MSIATHNDAMSEWARNVGWHDGNKESAWLLTDYDVWVRNPHYTGTPQPHPDSDYDDNEFDNDSEFPDDIPY